MAENAKDTATQKRSAATEASSQSDSDDDWIGPTPAQAASSINVLDESALATTAPLPLPQPKRRRLHFERQFLQLLPSAQAYEKSYMHRESITHLLVTPKTNFLITASQDGHVKFWKKTETGIEFVKHFRCHLAALADCDANAAGTLLCTVSSDRSMKIFDVVNFDMINMIKLDYTPSTAAFIHSESDLLATVAVADKESCRVLVYDARGSSRPLRVLDQVHRYPVELIKYNAPIRCVVSCDRKGLLEYWTGAASDYQFPADVVRFESKLQTDLFLYANESNPIAIAFSPDGQVMAILSRDRRIRLFRFLTGKCCKTLDESIKTNMESYSAKLGRVELARRLSVEKELEEKAAQAALQNLLFDDSGNFLFYSTLLGVKQVNLVTNQVVRILGLPEASRFLRLALFQGSAAKGKAAPTMQMVASDASSDSSSDPTLFCTAFNKNRFYMFSRREPMESSAAELDRDVFNEKPTKEEAMTAVEGSAGDEASKRTSNAAVIHTTVGDIHVQLFSAECPRTVENFCVHARNGYYASHLFHRVIRGFMIQTGDPRGDGTGGESIWGGEFEDEFHATLRHDRPYTLSMANAGPNTNGSQFFITVVPAPWLDQKHTVFGRVTRGIDIVQKISNVRTNEKTDKPLDDVAIVSVMLK